jgi:hypothetical protein
VLWIGNAKMDKAATIKVDVLRNRVQSPHNGVLTIFRAAPIGL